MRITLEKWYAQPVHCPFCGCATKLDEPEVSCRHWLYTAYFEFLTRSERFNKVAGLPEDLDPDMTTETTEKHGNNYEIINKNQHKFFNLVEYDLPTPSDGTLIGFAPIDE